MLGCVKPRRDSGNTYLFKKGMPIIAAYIDGMDTIHDGLAGACHPLDLRRPAWYYRICFEL